MYYHILSCLSDPACCLGGIYHKYNYYYPLCQNDIDIGGGSYVN